MATRMKPKPHDGNRQSSIEELAQDLTKLQDKSSESIVESMKVKYEKYNQTYSKIGARVLLALNGKDLTNSEYGPELIEQYFNDYQDFSGKRDPSLPSHIYQLANTTYFHLKRSGIDQAVIFKGDSGAGKTFQKHLYVEMLAKLRSSSKKESKFYKQLVNSFKVYNAFGHASTTQNSQASRFGLYTEIQFDAKGRTVGFKNLDYLLEKSRVVNNPDANFFAFYQLLAGTSQEEKSHFQLSSDFNHYNYLRGSRINNLNQLSEEFKSLKVAMRSLGFNPKFQSQVFQLLAAILHLGNLTFINPLHQSGDEAAHVRDQTLLSLVSDFLGLHPTSLENMLTYKTKLIKKEPCTVILNAEEATRQRDDLAKCLYGLLFAWISEHINTRLCAKSQDNFIALLDLPGTAYLQTNSNFQNFLANYANERLFNYMNYQVFEASNDTYREDNITTLPIFEFPNNRATVQLLSKKQTGLVALLHRQANRSKGPGTDSTLLSSFSKEHDEDEEEIFRVNSSMNQFTITHYFDEVTYSIDGFMDANVNSISADFVELFRNSTSGNPFVNGLFSNGTLTTESNPKGSGIVAAQQSAMPLRQPSMKKRQRNTKGDLNDGKVPCVASQFQSAMDELFDTFDDAETWFVLSLNVAHSSFLDKQLLIENVERYNLDMMVQRKAVEYTSCYQHDEFVARYLPILQTMGIDMENKSSEVIVDTVITIWGWDNSKIVQGNQFVYLNDEVWRDLEDNLRASELGEDFKLLNPDDDNQSNFSADNESIYSTSKDDGNFNLTRTVNETNEKADIVEKEEEQKPPKTKIRKCWLCFTWTTTFWVPSSFLSCCGRMKRADVRLAWREKLALCLIIGFLCLFVGAFVTLFTPLICPKREYFGPGEVKSYSDIDKKVYFSLYGTVYDYKKTSVGMSGDQNHPNQEKMMEAITSVDNNLNLFFPLQISSLCTKPDGSEISPQVSLQLNQTWIEGASGNYKNYHDKRWFRANVDADYQPNYVQEIVRSFDKAKVGRLAYYPEDVAKQSGSRKWFIYTDKKRGQGLPRIYDITGYSNAQLYPRYNEKKADQSEKNFFDEEFLKFVDEAKGKDGTDVFNNVLFKGDAEGRERLLQCLDNAFFAGFVDDRKSIRCQFAEYLLLIVSIFLFLIMFIKFLASLQLGSRPEPEDHDKFVLCNVPCYTEDDESLRRTIDSLATLKYDDKRKLLFIISDGMVIGGGNDLPTPRIVLNILKHETGSDNSDPEALSFLSLGDGMKQHNMAKVYTGLYECKGHIVPYLVVVKVGRPTERVKPGNRGKRDSQMILMRFFNKVHYDTPMVPLELEIYHQIKNVIGVDPHFYEFVLMVDADTVVMPDSLNRLVSAMLHDTKIMGVCGETALMNEKDSYATMIQVYEYYMSHYLAKSFESLFGSVTCLPGCFSLYRLRTSDGTKPLLINNRIITDYSENVVETLHMKNLLHLGEDRYLTTLLLKHFPFQKIKFTPDAKCITNAPDSFSVLLSQRRRWINSTIHNLMELVFLDQLCGFCCFSMRFIVFMDLFSTIVMPATLLYLGYIIYRLITDTDKLVSIASIGFLVAPYALQMLVFLIRRQWEHLGWMMIYFTALPVYAFFIPIYSFWHFDDFSWGNTRVVVGEGGKKKAVAADQEKFDPNSIPTRRWADYEKNEAVSDPSYSDKSQSVRSPSPSISHLPDRGLYPNNNLPVYNSHLNPYPNQPNTRPQSQMSNLRSNEFIPMNPMYSNNMPLTQRQTTYSNNHLETIHPSLPPYQPEPNSNLPSGLDIVNTIKYLISGSDLNQITKRQLRDLLDNHYNLPGFSDNNREFVNGCIDLVLKGEI